MSAPNFTPGPWRIGTPPPNGEQTIGTSKGMMVAVVTTGGDTPTLSNARLIAAAPELYEALLTFLENYPAGETMVLDGVFVQARVALAKARGEA